MFNMCHSSLCTIKLGVLMQKNKIQGTVCRDTQQLELIGLFIKQLMSRNELQRTLRKELKEDAVLLFAHNEICIDGESN